MDAVKSRATRILLVEDQGADVRLFRCALAEVKSWRVELDVVGDGEKAIAHLVESIRKSGRRSMVDWQILSPDLVILDLNLPKCSGAEILRWIRGERRWRTLPTVVLSSAPQDALMRKFRTEGIEADGYFSKPGDFEAFVALMSEIRGCYEAAALRALETIALESAHYETIVGRHRRGPARQLRVRPSDIRLGA